MKNALSRDGDQGEAIAELIAHPATIDPQVDERTAIVTALFDADYYRTQVRLPEHSDLLAHYFSVGAAAGLNPHPLFDTLYYLSMNGDVREIGMNPLAHYVMAGGAEGRSPHPLFDAPHYMAQFPRDPAAQRHPLLHFLEVGAAARKSPHLLFDLDFYCRSWRDLGTTNPLVHYLRFGSDLDRAPHPLFDVAHYRKNNPDVVAAKREPLTHFVLSGEAEGRSPHPLFDPAYYLRQCRGDPAAQKAPLRHFLRTGAGHRLNPHPLFDTAWYYDQSAPGELEDINPLAHFAEKGERQLRNPHPLFDTRLYHQTRPDVVESGMSAITHYLLAGASEGEQLNPWDWRPIGLDVDALVRRADNERWDLPGDLAFEASAAPRVSIVIPVHNHLALTLRCLHAVKHAEPSGSFEVIVIDDASSDATAATLSKIPGLRYLRNDVNLGFLHSCNRAAGEARGEYVLLLNNDTLPLQGFASRMVELFSTQADIGLVGSMLLFPDGRLQEAGGIMWEDASGWNYGRGASADLGRFGFVRDVDYCSGASIMLPRELWTTLGGFDARYAPAYYEDTDLAFRVREHGRRVVYQPLSRVVHIDGGTSGTDISEGAKRHQAINRPKFLERWRDQLATHGMPDRLPSNFYVRNAKKQALFIDAETPTPDRDSGSVDAFHFMRILQRFGYHVTFTAEANPYYAGRYTTDLQALGIECHHTPHRGTLEDLLKRDGERFDLVVICRAPIGEKCVDLVRAFAPNAKVVFDTVDLHFLRMEREAMLRKDAALENEARKMKAIELGIARRVDHSLVRGEYEAAELKRLGVQSVSCMPIMRPVVGARTSFDQRHRILFVGGFRHPPNVDAAKHLVSAIWPRVRERLPGVKLTIVGSNLTAPVAMLASRDVEVLGYVPNLEPIMETTRVNVAPLRWGAGLKGKVVSALSAGVPTVVSRIAAEGFEGAHGVHFMVADTPLDFAEAIISLYESRERWENMSKRGLELAQRNFSIEACERALEPVMRP